FSKLLARFEKAPPEGLFNPHLFSEEEMPSFWNSIFAAVIPVIHTERVPGSGNAIEVGLQSAIRFIGISLANSINNHNMLLITHVI
ncbi:hypothetical protein MJL81_28845, partial [Salmonella enterica subsp. enterica serovar Anatum]|nr:hypothetical protein [Salmonella enterica subsp. enterica serovar Anatum]